MTAVAHPIERKTIFLGELAHVCVRNESTEKAFLTRLRRVINDQKNALRAGGDLCR